MVIPETASTAAALTTVPPAKPANAEDAAKQFEALLIAQMLRSAREEASEEDSTASTMIDVGDQQFSLLLAHNGGLGLARLIAKGLQNPISSAPSGT
jgi:Rod binding domain-containing protein